MVQDKRSQISNSQNNYRSIDAYKPMVILFIIKTVSIYLNKRKMISLKINSLLIYSILLR